MWSWGSLLTTETDQWLVKFILFQILLSTLVTKIEVNLDFVSEQIQKNELVNKLSWKLGSSHTKY